MGPSSSRCPGPEDQCTSNGAWSHPHRPPRRVERALASVPAQRPPQTTEEGSRFDRLGDRPPRPVSPRGARRTTPQAPARLRVPPRARAGADRTRSQRVEDWVGLVCVTIGLLSALALVALVAVHGVRAVMGR